jgi:hypothetical protein
MDWTGADRAVVVAPAPVNSASQCERRWSPDQSWAYWPVMIGIVGGIVLMKGKMKVR